MGKYSGLGMGLIVRGSVFNESEFEYIENFVWSLKYP